MSYPAPEGTELVQRIGAGSVFHVAVIRAAGRVLVCKRLTTRAVNEPAGRAAIVREARVLSLAKHPALPSLVKVGTDAHGPFLLETRVEGASIRALVDGWRSRGKRVPPLFVRHIVRASIEALAEVHDLADEAGPLGIVHGDLGPDHLIVAPLGEARFIDFGAARFRGMDDSLLTDDRGTLPYVAPEIARSEASPSAVGDVYALAATLLLLASGGPIVSARDEAATLVEVGERGVRVELLEQAEGLLPSERAALRAALAIDPAARTKTARSLLSALGDA
jgi:serine/threonine-protein kinase